MKALTFLSRITLSFSFTMAVALVGFPQLLVAQTMYSTKSENAGTVKVKGTSDLQNWTMTSKEIESQGLFFLDNKNQLKSITQLSFSLKAKSLKGGLRPMDHKAHKALKASKHPDIFFQLDSAVVSLNQLNQQLIKATGSLTLKGIAHTVSLNLLAVTNPDQSLTITGSKALKLSDYLIKAPSFMGGAMQAGNDITIDFLLIYSPQTQILAEVK